MPAHCNAEADRRRSERHKVEDFGARVDSRRDQTLPTHRPKSKRSSAPPRELRRIRLGSKESAKKEASAKESSAKGTEAAGTVGGGPWNIEPNDDGARADEEEEEADDDAEGWALICVE